MVGRSEFGCRSHKERKEPGITFHTCSMSEKSKAWLQAERHGRTTSLLKLADKDILWGSKFGKNCGCDCRNCANIHLQGTLQVEAGAAGGNACVGQGGSDLLLASTTRPRGNACFNQYVYSTSTSRRVTKKEELDTKTKCKIRKLASKIAKIKQYVTSLQNTTAKISFHKTSPKCNAKPPLLINKQSKPIEKNSVSKTVPIIEVLSVSNSLTIDSSVNTSMHNPTVTYEKKHYYSILTGPNLISKLMLHLKPLFNRIFMKSRPANKLVRNKNKSSEQPTFILNCIFPCQTDSFVSEEISELQSEEQLRDSDEVSTMISVSMPSSESLIDQGNQVPSQTDFLSAIDYTQDSVKKISVCNFRSDCIIRSNNVVLQCKSRKSKTNIKKSRRVIFRGHHKRFMGNRYRHNFNKTYLTFLAEIDYNNPALLPCPPENRQGVNIGSTWDVNIDFGKSTDQAEPCPIFGTGANGGQGSGLNGTTLQQFQCPPGVCITGACDPKQCYKRLKKRAPYGSHATTQSRKYKSRDLRATKESMYVRKKMKGSKSRKARNGFSGNNVPFIPAPIGMPTRQSVRIGSKQSFDVQLYKETPIRANSIRPFQGRQSTLQYDRGDTTVQQKSRKNEKRRRPLGPFECEPGICVRGKCNPSECFKPVPCKPKICVPGKCDPSVCYKKQRVLNTGTDPYFDDSSIGSSQVATQSRKLNERRLRAGKETFYKEKGVFIKPRPITPPNMRTRQAVRIGSKCSFNIEFYKNRPQNGPIAPVLNDQSDTSGRQKARSKSMKNYQCEPGVCVPGKCNPNECFQQLKMKQSIGTDASITSRSNVTTQASQVSGKAQKIKQLMTDKVTFCRDVGISCIPTSKMPNHKSGRQAVRIGSKHSFNVEFYKSTPQKVWQTRMPEQLGTESQSMGLRKYQCDPGICVPDACNANECFQVLKNKQAASGYSSSMSGGSKSSRVINKKRKNIKVGMLTGMNSTFYKDPGVSSKSMYKRQLHMPTRQAVRIGSDHSFNVEFYKSWPQNGWQTRTPQQPGTESQGMGLRKYQCDPGICVPGTCNAKECFQVLKNKQGASGYGSSMTGSSKSSRVINKKPKNVKVGMLTGMNSTLSKDTGVSSMSMYKRQLHMPNRQAVRIGSKLSFNVEFYKGNPNNMQTTRSIPNKPRNIFECAPGVCIPGKCNPSECLKQFECKPSVCVPGKCNPIDCMQRLRTPTGTATDTSFTGSSRSTQSHKLKKQQLKSGSLPQSTIVYKEKGVSNVQKYKHKMRSANRQAVRIGSSCSFNIEFFKQMGPPIYVQNYPNQMSPSNQSDTQMQYATKTEKKRKALNKYECVPGVCIPGKCSAVECFNRLKGSQMSGYQSDDSSVRRKTGAKSKGKPLKRYECPPGLCIPGQCNAMECQNKLLGLPTSALAPSGTSGRRKPKMKKKHRPLKDDECAPGVCTPGKCNAVECFHRLRGLSGSKKYECQPGVCVPGKCNPKECLQLFKAKRSADDILTDSSVAASRASQVSAKKRKSKGPDLSQKNATFFKETGAASMPRAKTQLHMRNRQAVRIGSTCSFNIEFYKELPKKGLTGQPIQRRSRPFQYSIDQQDHQSPAYFYSSSSETGKDRPPSAVCECRKEVGGQIETLPENKKTRSRDKKGKKEKIIKEKKPQTEKTEIIDMKETRIGKRKTPKQKVRRTEKKRLISEKKEKDKGKGKVKGKVKKERVSEKKDKVVRKKETPKVEPRKEKKEKSKKKTKNLDQGDVTKIKRKEVKQKPIKDDTSAQQAGLSDTPIKTKPSIERKEKALKEKPKQKYSQTTVRDQQSDTVVDKKVGTGTLLEQGDIKPKQKEERREDIKNEGTSTDGSLSKVRSTDSISVTRATSVNLDRKEEEERRKTQAKTLPVHKDMGTESIVISKKHEEIPKFVPPQPQHTPGPKKQAVRIGSSCSFNIQIYRERPLTPAQIGSLRSVQKPERPEIKIRQEDKKGFMSFIKKCCKFIKSNDGGANSVTGVQHGSQTSQRQCIPGYCNLSICERNQCPARTNYIDAGTGTYFRDRSAVPYVSAPAYSTNAATQSRRYPGLQQMALNDSSFAALCKCMGKMGPSTRLRNGPYAIQGGYPFGPITGFGDDINRYQIKEQAVILGSGCGFNCNFFRKR